MVIGEALLHLYMLYRSKKYLADIGSVVRKIILRSTIMNFGEEDKQDLVLFSFIFK